MFKQIYVLNNKKIVNSNALMISRSASENLCPTLTKRNVMQSSTVTLKRKGKIT